MAKPFTNAFPVQKQCSDSADCFKIRRTAEIHVWLDFPRHRPPPPNDRSRQAIDCACQKLATKGRYLSEFLVHAPPRSVHIGQAEDSLVPAKRMGCEKRL